MDFRHIDAFRALMLTHTTSKAAQLLGTSQSAVSRLIAQLEKSSGVQFFHRARGRLEPTQEAIAFFEEVQRHYAGLDKMRQYIVSMRSPATAVIKIGAVTSFGLGFLSKVIARFRAIHPSVQVAVVTGGSDFIHDLVASHQLAMGVVTDSVDAVAVQVSSFAKLSAVCAIPHGHPLVKRKQIRATDLKGHAVIAYDASDMVRWGLDDIFMNAGIDDEVVASARYSVNIATMVRENVGVGLLHPVAAYDFLDSNIILRPFTPAVSFHTLILTNVAPPPNPLVTDLTEIMHQVLHEVLDAVRAKVDVS